MQALRSAEQHDLALLSAMRPRAELCTD